MLDSIQRCKELFMYTRKYINMSVFELERLMNVSENVNNYMDTQKTHFSQE